MIDEKSFLNLPEENVDMESSKDNNESIVDLPEVKNEEKQVRTKHEAQEDVFEKFGIRKTSDFVSILEQGKTELAEKWLRYIMDNKNLFPQYHSTWDNWLSDRHKELDFYNDLKARGEIAGRAIRSKNEAQQDLIDKFGIRKTSDFKLALENGQIEFASGWLEHIKNNKLDFPQYLSTWKGWYANRERELEDVKANLLSNKNTELNLDVEDRETKIQRLLDLVGKINEQGEILRFPGVNGEAYLKMKATDEEFPGYTTPIDEIVKRCEEEGIKIVTGNNPGSGNIFVLPANSNDIEMDSFSPYQLNIEMVENEDLKKLILLTKK